MGPPTSLPCENPQGKLRRTKTQDRIKLVSSGHGVTMERDSVHRQ